MALPSSPLLDNFSRPNENPLSYRGAWASLDGSSGMRLVSLLAGLTTTGEAMRYWTYLPGLTNSEAWVTLADQQSGFVTQLVVRASDPGAGTWNAYMAQFLSDVTIYRITDGGGIAIANGPNTRTNGDQYILRAIGSTISVYRNRVGEQTTLLCEGTDSTYSSGFVGFGGQGSSTGRWANFGGGAADSLVAPTHPIGGFGAT